jgi:hypothetical protein
MTYDITTDEGIAKVNDTVEGIYAAMDDLLASAGASTAEIDAYKAAGAKKGTDLF